MLILIQARAEVNSRVGETLNLTQVENWNCSHNQELCAIFSVMINYNSAVSSFQKAELTPSLNPSPRVQVANPSAEQTGHIYSGLGNGVETHTLSESKEKIQIHCLENWSPLRMNIPKLRINRIQKDKLSDRIDQSCSWYKVWLIGLLVSCNPNVLAQINCTENHSVTQQLTARLTVHVCIFLYYHFL